jgi:rfaE bifunctional protein kinase chain/domain
MGDSAELLIAVMKTLPSARVTVFGDYCLDAYWDIDDGASELSLETGLAVRRVKKQRYSLGGAGSVVANLTQMGVGCVRVVGLAGADMFGETLRSLLVSTGAETSGFLLDTAWETMVYAKPFFGAREDSRIDFGTFNHVTPSVLDRLLGELNTAIEQSDAVVLNQQVPGGVSSPALIKRINELIAAYPKVTFLADSRHYPGDYEGAALKLNMSEATRLLKEESTGTGSDERARDIALRVNQKTGKPFFLTRGERGLAVALDGQATLIPGLQVIESADPVGAGDAVVAALAAGLAVGAPAFAAAALANAAAMITVKKVRTTGTASSSEILAAIPDLNYIFSPELADSPRHAHYLSGTEIEIVTKLPGDLVIRHCIFDHDGTLSTLREGWEQIMEPMMVRAILGKQYDLVGETEFERVRESVKQFIDRTTGIQTLVQMQGLADLVRKSGFVSSNEILDEHGYKHIFNVELLDRVKARVDKLNRGELKASDFQIKNAQLLMEELHGRGVKLYLASGTDEADVIAEAEAMGYAHFFEGRIFGAVGKVDVEAKKVVLENIIRENNLSGHEFATFGDGPVEMRETQRRGGLCIGVASDELRRFGLNLSKRRRLIRAGADIIIPDYSQLAALLTALQLGKSEGAMHTGEGLVTQ